MSSPRTGILSLIRFDLGQNWNVYDKQIKIYGWMDQGHHSWYLATLLLVVEVVGPCDFSVSPSTFGLDFGTLDLGLTILIRDP